MRGFGFGQDPVTGQMVSKDPLAAQGYRTQRAELPEDLWQPLYDRVNYAAGGANTLSFFSIPRGQSATLITAGSAAAKAKTYRDTNMENAGVIPTKMFKFVGISWAMVHLTPATPTNPADRDKLREGGYLHFRIVDKDLLYLPLIAMPECNPQIAMSTTAATTTMIGGAGGGGANVPMYKLPIPITLNPYENFSLALNWDGTVTLTNAVDVYVILHGYMRRPT